MKVQLDMYQTQAIAVLVLLLGSYLRKKIKFLERFCIPAPVVGGLLFAIFTCICYVTHILEFSFDDTLKEVCMVFFFTSVGFQANLKVLKKGGKSMVIFLGLVIVLIFIQNGVAVGLSKVIGLDSLIGMCTGSIPMVGGHGTAGAFGPVLEDFNVKGATTICTAAATFGLIFGSLVGGPLGKRLIEKKNLLDTAIPEDDSLLIEDEKKHERHSRMYASAVFQLIIAIGIGTIFSWALTKTGLTFPIYIGAMIAAALMRNIAEYAGNGKPVYSGLDIHFNLSHAGTCVVCAVSDRAVGIDIERPRKNAIKVAERFFTQEECDWIGDDSLRFARIWTLKEAYAKLTGDGIAGTVSKVEFRHETSANMASVVNMYISGKKADNIKIYELNIIKQKYVISAMEYIKN